LLHATKLLHPMSEARGESLTSEITIGCDFALATEGAAAAVGLRTRELRECAPVAHPRYGNTQGALC